MKNEKNDLARGDTPKVISDDSRTASEDTVLSPSVSPDQGHNGNEYLYAVSDNPRCARCGGPHPFDTSVPSVVWNETIRANGLPEYLCLNCIVQAFVSRGKGFTAELSGGGFSLYPIEVRANNKIAQDAATLSEENTLLRHQRFAPVVAYVTEEVSRQGHDVESLDGLERVGWMLDAWLFAHSLQSRPAYFKGIQWFDVQEIGKRIEREKNRGGFRNCEVRVGSRKCPAASRVRKLLDALLEAQQTLTPIEFYKAFEEVHPFVDGNGRTGKILLNWLNGTLFDPVFPPGNLWGREIRNP